MTCKLHIPYCYNPETETYQCECGAVKYDATEMSMADRKRDRSQAKDVEQHVSESWDLQVLKK
jgi:hypothetical protein